MSEEQIQAILAENARLQAENARLQQEKEEATKRSAILETVVTELGETRKELQETRGELHDMRKELHQTQAKVEELNVAVESVAQGNADIAKSLVEGATKEVCEGTLELYAVGNKQNLYQLQGTSAEFTETMDENTSAALLRGETYVENKSGESGENKVFVPVFDSERELVGVVSAEDVKDIEQFRESVTTGVTGNAVVGIMDKASAEVEKEEAERKAYTDELTGLYSKAGLNQHVLPEMILEEIQNGQEFTLISVDLDLLHEVNLQGHKAGDAALKALGDTLTAAVGDNGYTFRMGGDEFMVMFRGNGVEAFQMIEEARKQFCGTGIPAIGEGGKPIVINDPEHEGGARCSLSAGIAECGFDAEQVTKANIHKVFEAVEQIADDRLSSAKENDKAKNDKNRGDSADLKKNRNIVVPTMAIMQQLSTDELVPIVEKLEGIRNEVIEQIDKFPPDLIDKSPAVRAAIEGAVQVQETSKTAPVEKESVEANSREQEYRETSANVDRVLSEGVLIPKESPEHAVPEGLLVEETVAIQDENGNIEMSLQLAVQKDGTQNIIVEPGIGIGQLYEDETGREILSLSQYDAAYGKLSTELAEVYGVELEDMIAQSRKELRNEMVESLLSETVEEVCNPQRHYVLTEEYLTEPVVEYAFEKMYETYKEADSAEYPTFESYLNANVSALYRSLTAEMVCEMTARSILDKAAEKAENSPVAPLLEEYCHEYEDNMLAILERAGLQGILDDPPAMNDIISKHAAAYEAEQQAKEQASSEKTNKKDKSDKSHDER